MLGLVLGSLLPVALFLRAAIVGLSVAVTSLSWTWSAAVFRGTTVGRAAPTSSAPPPSASPAIIKATAGIVSQDQTLYLGWASPKIWSTASPFRIGSAGPPLVAGAVRPAPVPDPAERTAHRARFAAHSSSRRQSGCAATACAILRCGYHAVPKVPDLLGVPGGGYGRGAGQSISRSFAFTAWYPLRARCVGRASWRGRAAGRSASSTGRTGGRRIRASTTV